MAMTGARAAAVARPDAAASPATSRAGWMDNLRVAVIAGVIILHAATAYILDVDWYYQERTTSTLTPLLLAFPALLGGLFGLGPLFLLGGLLAAASLAHKGPGGFARGRLVRLGLPLLAFFVLLDPLTGYLGALAEGDHPRLWPYLADQTGTRDTGPLWFVAVLLALSLAYAGLRRLRPARVGVTAGVGPRQLAAVAAVIAAGSFMMRLVSPLATDTYANLTWAAWPQATGLFTLGVLAGERGRLESLDRRWLRRLGWVAVAGLLALAVLAASALATDRGDAVAGGWTWQAAALALLEGLVAVGLSLWVVAWFRRRWDRRGALVRRVGRGSYAAYVLHPPVLVLASMATRPLPLAPEGKFVLVAAVGVAASFTLGAALTWRRVVVHVERPRVA
jgi:glucan biosynthesis protein C